MNEYRSVLERAGSNFAPLDLELESILRGRDRRRRNQRIAAGVVGIAVFVVAVWIVTSGGAFDRSTPAVPGGSETGPAQSSTSEGVTLLLEPRSDGRCCLVTSVNPGDSSAIVWCFVQVFDEADRLSCPRTWSRRSRRAIAAPAASRHRPVDRGTDSKRSLWTFRTSSTPRHAFRRRGKGVPRSEPESQLRRGR